MVTVRSLQETLQYLSQRSVRMGVHPTSTKGYVVDPSTGSMPNLRMLLHKFHKLHGPTHHNDSITLRRGRALGSTSELDL